jgi:enoyl-CoA hydratase/carnithine racemase
VAVQLDIEERVLVIRLKREDKRNAFDQELSVGIEVGLDRLEDDDELWAGILTGTPLVFSAGSDLKDGLRARTDRGGEYGLIRRRRTKPLIAAVEGLAFGGGFEAVLACDLVVAARDARFGLPVVKRGLVATSGGLFRAPRALPLHVVKEMVATGDPLSAERLFQLGVVNRVTEPGGALAGALDLAAAVNANGPVAVRASLQAVDRIVAADDAAGWAATEEARATIAASEDMREGVAAFFEKRSPNWKGR